MANFAVAASDEVIKKGNTILERMANPGEKKGETLNRILDLVAASLDGEIIRSGGVDTEALEAALANIRNLFLAAVSGKAEVLAKKEADLREMRSQRLVYEAAAQKQIEEAKAAREAAETENRTALNEITELKKELDRTADMLKYLDSIKEQFREAKEKAAHCNDLEQSNADLKKQLADLAQKCRDREADFSRQIEVMKREHEAGTAALTKDHETALRELQAKSERQVSDAVKDAALSRQKALSDLERELNASVAEKLRELDRINIRLQMENEDLRGQLDSLQAADTAAQADAAEEPESSEYSDDAGITGD